MTNARHLGELKAGDTVRWGNGGDTATVEEVLPDGRIRIKNPQAGNIYGNRNRAPKAQTFKPDSKRLSALTGIPPAGGKQHTAKLPDGTPVNVYTYGKKRVK